MKISPKLRASKPPASQLQEECVICGRPHPGETLQPVAPYAVTLWGEAGSLLAESGATLSPYCLHRALRLSHLPHDTLYTRGSPPPPPPIYRAGSQDPNRPWRKPRKKASGNL